MLSTILQSSLIAFHFFPIDLVLLIKLSFDSQCVNFLTMTFLNFPREVRRRHLKSYSLKVARCFWPRLDSGIFFLISDYLLSIQFILFVPEFCIVLEIYIWPMEKHLET